MKTIAILLLALSLLGCATTHQPHPPIVEEPCTVSIEFVGKAYTLGVVVRFKLVGAGYTHIVQEITLDNGEVLVECFRDRACLDRHTWTDRPHSRTMTVYAANCVGVDEWGGFGHLPDNGNGLSTTVGTDFNEDYWTDHEMRGRIESRAPNEIVWSISDDGTAITVVIDGEIK